MAKNSFIFYEEYEQPLSMLDDAERGQLLMALIRYSKDGTIPDISPAANMAFAFIKAQMDRDTDKYNDTVRKRSEAGKQGGKASKNAVERGNQKTLQETSSNPEEANASFDKQNKQMQTKKANAFFDKQNKQMQTKQAVNVDVDDDVDVNEDVDVDVDVSLPPIIPPAGDGESDSPSPEAGESTGFLEFWDAYPKQENRRTALLEWRKLHPSAALRQKIMQALAEQCRKPQWRQDGGRDIPQAANWLSKRLWEDKPVRIPDSISNPPNSIAMDVINQVIAEEG